MKKVKTYLHLSEWDRCILWKMRGEGKAIRYIARFLQRSASTISKELKRNDPGRKFRQVSSATEIAQSAHCRARERQKTKLKGKRKILREAELMKFIAHALRVDRWSPETISGYIRNNPINGQAISTSTIYRIIKTQRKDLIKYLYLEGKPLRQNVSKRRSALRAPAPTKRHVSQRELEVTRKELGHFELDIIKGIRNTKPAILSIVDRCSRFVWLIKVDNLKSDTVRDALVKWLLSKKIKHTLTFDNGSEFAGWNELEKIFPGVKSYFCTPYAPHEKGSVERSNRNVRIFFPKGTDFTNVTEEDLKWVEQLLRRRPLKMFGFLSPIEFEGALLKKQAA